MAARLRNVSRRVRIPYPVPVLRSNEFALVAQRIRALGYEPRGREFESLRAHQVMFESTVPEKFKGLKCATCGVELAVGSPCKVQTDVSGWLLWAECIKCPCSECGELKPCMCGIGR